MENVCSTKVVFGKDRVAGRQIGGRLHFLHAIGLSWYVMNPNPELSCFTSIISVIMHFYQTHLAANPQPNGRYSHHSQSSIQSDNIVLVLFALYLNIYVHVPDSIIVLSIV